MCVCVCVCLCAFSCVHGKMCREDVEARPERHQDSAQAAEKQPMYFEGRGCGQSEGSYL